MVAHRLLRHRLVDGDPMANQLTGCCGSDEKMAADCRPGADFSLPFACWYGPVQTAAFLSARKRTRTVTRAADGEMKSDPAPLLGFPCPSWPPFLSILFSLVFGGRFCCNPHTTRRNVESTQVAGCRQNGRHFPSKKPRRWRALRKLVASPAKSVTWPSVYASIFTFCFQVESSFVAEVETCRRP
jgi:hypothetical protein